MSHFLSITLAAIVGLFSGLHTAIWGMYKDAVHEGFGVARFLRSVVIGAGAAVAIQAALQVSLAAPAGIVVLFGLAYAGERGIVEVWKTFVREEDQSKYFIPMQFSFRGQPVASRVARLMAGATYVTVVATALSAIARLDRIAGQRPTLLSSALVGVTVGMVVAIGGCWKDAPKEGFDLLKFFRSPLMTVLCAMMLSALTDSHLQVAVAAIGYERATAETYKTFFFPSKPRGKFTGKPILHPDMLERRRYFVPAYVAISGAVLLCITAAL